MGRRRKAGKKIWMPASEWIWSAEPTHTPQRIRARFTDLYTQRTTLETELAALEDTPCRPPGHHGIIISGVRLASVLGRPSSMARRSAMASRRRIRPAIASLVSGGSAS
jgi:hypothetical protein